MTYYDYLIVYDNGNKTILGDCKSRMNINVNESFVVIDCSNLRKRILINLNHVQYIEENTKSHDN